MVMLKRCAPDERSDIDAPRVSSKLRTVFIKNTISFLVVCLMPLSYLHLQDVDDAYDWNKRYYTETIIMEKPALPQREAIPEPVEPVKPSPPPKRSQVGYGFSEESITYKKQLNAYRGASIAYMIEKRRYETLQEVRRADEQKFNTQLKEWEYRQSERGKPISYSAA